MSPSAPPVVELSFTVEEPDDRWLLEGDDVPETPLHDAVIELLMLVLKHWVATSERSALVCSNLGCRWDPSNARVGVDPDVVLIEPRPPEGEALKTLRVWEPGHHPPRVAIEVVSETQPEKDYLQVPLRCARLGAKELWVFDPLLVGPEDTGGPFHLQIWRQQIRTTPPQMRRVYAGAGPFFSEELGAWLVVTDDGFRLRLAHDREGRAPWPTAYEAERGEKERERTAKERERAEKERERAEKEQERAEKERERAEKERLAAKLRSLGVDPEEF